MLKRLETTIKNRVIPHSITNNILNLCKDAEVSQFSTTRAEKEFTWLGSITELSDSLHLSKSAEGKGAAFQRPGHSYVECGDYRRAWLSAVQMEGSNQTLNM